MLLVIDNYDSFTFNLVQSLGRLGATVLVKRNDAVTVEDVETLCPRQIIVSPGPKTPREAGNCLAILERFIGRIPILGVCLGHQALGEVCGGRVVRGKKPVHGKASRIYHRGEGIFRDLPSPFWGGRYHSLVVERESLPSELDVVAEDEEGVIMGLRVRGTQTWGLQFHPESVLTPEGEKLLRNFLLLGGR